MLASLQSSWTDADEQDQRGYLPASWPQISPSYLETGGSQEELVPLDRKMKKGMGVALACSLPAGDVGSGGVDPDAETRRSVSVMEGKGQGAAGT